MWRYLSTNQANTDDIYFLSLESRLAIIARASKLAAVNSEFGALRTYQSVFSAPASLSPHSATKDLYCFLLKEFIDNGSFRRSSELIFLTYTLTGSALHASPLFNDLKYFALFYSRFGSLRPKFERSLRYEISTTWLEHKNSYVLRSFGYKRRFMQYNSIAQPYYLLQLIWSVQVLEMWYPHKSQQFQAEKGFNISTLLATPDAYSGFLYFEEL